MFRSIVGQKEMKNGDWSVWRVQHGLNHAGSLTRVDSSRRSNEELRRGLDHAGSPTRAYGESEKARRANAG